MPDILVDNLTMQQVDELSKLYHLFQPPNDSAECRNILTVLEAARLFYTKELAKLREGERGA